ncbi:DUF5689 domain-containing protein [Aridibaculum aurantiacum]|uniref:DUF5689 domain-containing protein n=1 Tax=Aridibaculum aurantiacum TaxID=2810307 RepID=UPI001A9602D3|nr:DUF5689 domain-containing protein [Aridibaculum aurantiacum]
MKKLETYFIILLCLSFIAGCKKDKYGNYPGGRIGPFIAIYDVRDLYHGEDIALTKERLYGSSSITGVVVSDHSGKNLPEGLLVIQDRRRLNELRGISIALGARAADYVPGDSVIVNIEGGTLKRVNDILQITGLNAAAVNKVSSGNEIPVNRVPAHHILANPDKYESVLSVIVKGGFNPVPGPNEVLAGNKLLNDGFGDLPFHTEATATFANNKPFFLANYYGIVFSVMGADKQLKPQFRVRTADDIVLLSSTVNVSPIIITGFISDVKGGDGNYEYAQFMATREIDFSATPFSVVVTNNANASVPTGFPVNGWGTGGARTFKFNLTSGTAAKGTFFYVGGAAKMINGANSTSIANANWIRSFNYVNTGGDGFGNATSGLFANSGNASGLAVFEGTTVNASTTPIDVLFVATGGSLYTPGPPERGYRIANTDFYDIKNPITLQDQPFYRQGSNTLNMVYTTADMGYFYKMGGAYNVTLGRWMQARTQTNVLLEKTSTLAEIEGEGSTVLLQ